jgi:hypothetical protein
MPRVRRPPDGLRGYLAAFEPRIGRLFVAARALVLGAAPDANELVYDAYNAVSAAYTFSDRLAEAFCHVAAYASHVNLGFNRGAELPDPAGLLAGSGARIRHVRIDGAGDLRTPALQGLLRAAVAQGRGLVSDAPAKPTSRVRPTTGAKRRPRPGVRAPKAR